MPTDDILTAAPELSAPITHVPASTTGRRTMWSAPPRPSTLPLMPLVPLRAPLLVKLVGAHLAAIALAFVPGLAASGVGNGWGIAIGSVVYVALVLVALRPIRDLEGVARRMWQGDYAARVDASSVADHEVLRIGSMFNLLLDRLMDDRARMRTLATQVIEVGDRERASLARELHDSTAQRLAALLMHLGVLASQSQEPPVRAHLEELRDEMRDVLEEVRGLSHTVHPRVLDDLGLAAALRNLARETERLTGLRVDVSAGDTTRIAPHILAVLYRVAQEALRNVTQHAGASRAWITVADDAALASIVITDNGHGFDVDAGPTASRGMGLFSMRERVDLVDGTFAITSGSAGTTVSASVPVA